MITTTSIEFYVPGEARTYSNDEQKWRISISEYVKENVKLPPMSMEEREFKVELCFFLKNDRLFDREGNDVDNFAKPVIDTLFLAPGKSDKPNPTGILFKTNDTFVTEIVVRKTIAADSAEGADVRVSWRELGAGAQW